MKTVKKYKLSRRLKTPIFEKTQTQKFAMREQSRAPKRFGMMSEFGKQLIEKQKVRFLYSITERTLTSYVADAIRKQKAGQTKAQDILAQDLEKRLDSVVYHLGLADTRRMARQLVSHGHFTINGKRNNIPSYHVKMTDVIGVMSSSATSNLFKAIFEKMKGARSPFVTWNDKEKNGMMTGQPEGEKGIINFSAVLEYYSR